MKAIILAVLLSVSVLASGQILAPILNPAAAISAGHAMVLVQTGTCAFPGTGTNTYLNCTFGSGFTSGHIAIYFSINQTYAQLTASSVGTFIKVPSANSVGNGVTGVITGIPGSTTSFTVTTPSAYIATATVPALVFEVSGVNASSPIETSCGFSSNLSSGSSCSVTTTGPYDEICSAVAATTPGTGYGAASGYTAGYSLAGITYSVTTPAAYYGLFECSNSSQGAGTYTPTFTTGGASSQYDTTIAFTLN